ncbi:hypothetical protein [Enterococcus malodoratus]|uniref:hypothetical protein n=1 Tax=Enterococcus malodoratus TaxID=71451 RepID=UPI0022E14381|nr:hypothetical protein [Enterococcus malodoratus]
MRINNGIVSLLLIILLMLTGCSGGSSATTTSSLEKEVTKLRTENSKLKKELSTGGTDEKKTQASDAARFTQEVKSFSKNEAIEFGDGEKKLAEMKVVEVTTKQSAFPKRMNELWKCH